MVTRRPSSRRASSRFSAAADRVGPTADRQGRDATSTSRSLDSFRQGVRRPLRRCVGRGVPGFDGVGATPAVVGPPWWVVQPAPSRGGPHLVPGATPAARVAHFEQAPGWRITLPRKIGDVLHNAKVMRNCTADLIEDVLQGSVFLVIVHDPEGHRYNVAVTGSRGRFSVGRINSWANGGIEPPWIRPAFTRHMNEPEAFPDWENQVSPDRPPTTRRDRRRSRARAARRRKAD